jgi:hypothetical protein
MEWGLIGAGLLIGIIGLLWILVQSIWWSGDLSEEIRITAGDASAKGLQAGNQLSGEKQAQAA